MSHPSVPLARAQLPPLPPGVRPLTDEQLRWLRAQHEDLVTGPDRCITCRGKRTFRWWTEDRTEVVEYDCPCDDQYVLHLRLLYAGVGLGYQRLGWGDFFEHSEERLGPALEFLENSEAFLAAGLGLLLHGSMGTGKTMTAELMTKELVCRHKVDAMSITFSALLQDFSGGWRDPGLRAWFSTRIRNAGLLVVNDIGREHHGERSIADSTLEDVLRHRTEYAKPTILSSNWTPAKLATFYGANTASLLAERTTVVEFRGVDRRPTVHARVRDEALRGLTRPIVIA